MMDYKPLDHARAPFGGEVRQMRELSVARGDYGRADHAWRETVSTDTWKDTWRLQAEDTDRMRPYLHTRAVTNRTMVEGGTPLCFGALSTNPTNLKQAAYYHERK